MKWEFWAGKSEKPANLDNLNLFVQVSEVAFGAAVCLWLACCPCSSRVPGSFLCYSSILDKTINWVPFSMTCYWAIIPQNPPTHICHLAWNTVKKWCTVCLFFIGRHPSWCRRQYDLNLVFSRGGNAGWPAWKWGKHSINFSFVVCFHFFFVGYASK